MLARSRCTAPVCLLGVICGATVVLAQSESDIKTVEKARSIYSVGPIPGSISCGVTVDWDGFFQRMKIEPTDDGKARLEKLKNVKIAVVSRDAEHTETKVEGADTLSSGLADGLRQQLQGFFQIYWSQSYGRVLGKRGDKFELTTGPEGYLIKEASGSTKAVIEMNKAYIVTRATVDAPGVNATVKPGFKAGEDGLLRMSGIEETIDLGSTKMVLNMSLDYQKVGIYDIPQHISMNIPGSFGFDYTLNSCEVKSDSGAAPAAK